MTKAYDNSLLARNISISGTNTNVSGLLVSTSGNFTNALQLNNVNVSVSGHSHVIGDVAGLQTSLDAKQASGNYALSLHTHTSSNITDFNSSVSGLLPVKNIIAGTNTSITNSSGAFTINSIPVISYTTTSNFPSSGISTSYYLASDFSRFYQWTGSQYVEIGPTFDTISANNITLGTLSDARLSSNVVLHEQLNTKLGQAANTVDSVPRVDAAAGAIAGAGQVLVGFFTPTATITVSQITMGTSAGAVAAGLTLARMGIYTYPTEGGTATLVARTASDTTLFAANNTLYTRSLDTTGGYPSTFTLQAGTRYGVAYLCVGTTQPQLVCRTVPTAIGSSLSPRLSGSSALNQTDLPISFTPLTNSQAPFARLT